MIGGRSGNSHRGRKTVDPLGWIKRNGGIGRTGWFNECLHYIIIICR